MSCDGHPTPHSEKQHYPQLGKSTLQSNLSYTRIYSSSWQALLLVLQMYCMCNIIPTPPAYSVCAQSRITG